jgi:hypothetical protein
VDDPDAVVAALAANGTLPPMNNKHRFTEFMKETGTWSPRAREVAVARGAWHFEEETAWWLQHYAQAPRWLTDERIVSGRAMQGSRAEYQAVMKETGNFDEAARIQRQLGPDENISIHDLAHGNPEKSLEPSKTLLEERQYMIQRYGKLVSDDDITLTACPWLMTQDEIGTFMAKNSQDYVPGVLKSADDIAQIKQAIQKTASKYADVHIKALGATGEVTFDDATIQEIAYETVRELSSTTPWRKPLQGFKEGGVKGALRAALNAWEWVWVTSVVSNPMFTILNSTDIPIRATWFGLTDRMARAGIKVSAETKLRTPTIDSFGLGAVHAFDNGFPRRSPLQRVVKNRFGTRDTVAGIFDAVFQYVPRKVLGLVEDTSKHRLGQQMYEGMSKNKEVLEYFAKHNLSPDEADLFMKLEVKKNLEKMFPTLANVGDAERLLNKVFPFVSYYAKNQLIWVGEMLDHPWALNAIIKWNEQLYDHNMKEWDERFPESAGFMPEHLRSQISLGFDIGGSPVYLDVGVFVDATRGMAVLTNEKAHNTYGDLMKRVFRPLPSQVAFFNQAMWDAFRYGGRKKLVKVLDENGVWNGQDYDEITVPPGTPWGDDGFDYLADVVWPVDFLNAVTAGDLPFGERLRVISSMVTWGALASPSRYFMMNQHYFALLEADPDKARAWLKSEEGEALRKMWAENYKPLDAAINPFALSYGEGDPIPTREQLRTRWLKEQSPELRDKMFAVWDEMDLLHEQWDLWMDGFDSSFAKLDVSFLRSIVAPSASMCRRPDYQHAE